MSTIVHIVLPLSEKFQEVILNQQGAAQYAHNFEDRSAQLEVVLNNGNKTVGDNGDVNLYTHGILAVTPETLDTEMLLDPLEKKLNLPSITIKQCDVFCGKVEVVGVVHKGTSKVFGIIDNPPDPADVRLLLVWIPTQRIFDSAPLVWICNPDPLSIRIFNPPGNNVLNRNCA